MVDAEDQAPAVSHSDKKTGASPRTKTPAKRLIEVLGRPIVIILAVVSFGGSIALCLVGAFYPTYIPSQISRFFFCLLAAFLFSVFVFTLFPANYEVKGKKFNLPIVLVGPAALWIGLFIFLWKALPQEDVAARVFLPAAGGSELTYSTTWVLAWKPTQPVYYKLKSSGDQNNVDPNVPTGFYVQFDSAHDQYTAEVGVGPSSDEIVERYEVVFSRGSSTYTAKSVTPNGR